MSESQFVSSRIGRESKTNDQIHLLWTNLFDSMTSAPYTQRIEDTTTYKDYQHLPNKCPSTEQCQTRIKHIC